LRRQAIDQPDERRLDPSPRDDGYDTGDDPANTYLKNIGLQLVIQNIFDKHADYQYKGTNTGGSGCTCNPLRADYGRQVSFIITKTW